MIVLRRRNRTVCDYRPHLISDFGLQLIVQAFIALVIVYLIVGPGETLVSALLGIN